MHYNNRDIDRSCLDFTIVLIMSSSTSRIDIDIRTSTRHRPYRYRYCGRARGHGSASQTGKPIAHEFELVLLRPANIYKTTRSCI